MADEDKPQRVHLDAVESGRRVLFRLTELPMPALLNELESQGLEFPWAPIPIAVMDPDNDGELKTFYWLYALKTIDDGKKIKVVSGIGIGVPQHLEKKH